MQLYKAGNTYWAEISQGKFAAIPNQAAAKSAGIKLGDATVMKSNWKPKTTMVWNLNQAKKGGGNVTTTAKSTSINISSNPNFKYLDKDDQEGLIALEKLMNSQDTESQNLTMTALKMATKDADPFSAEKMRIVQDELTRNLQGLKTNYAYTKQTLEEEIKQINEDLATKSGDLSIDKQAELARLARSYEVQLENLQEGVSQTGLTYSSKRTTAEGRLSTENRALVEDTQRQYERSIRDLQTLARRGNQEAQAKLATLETKYKQGGTAFLRSSEARLGTKNLPSFSGYDIKPLGNIEGTLSYEKTQDIWERQPEYFNQLSPFEFENL